MVILAGGELFTGNCLFLLPLLWGDITGGRTMGNWAIVYCRNLIGSIVIAFIVVRCGVLDSIAPAAIATAAAKAVYPSARPFCGEFCVTSWCAWRWDGLCGVRRGQSGFLYGPIFCLSCVALSTALPICSISGGDPSLRWGGSDMAGLLESGACDPGQYGRRLRPGGYTLYAVWEKLPIKKR